MIDKQTPGLGEGVDEMDGLDRMDDVDLDAMAEEIVRLRGMEGKTVMVGGQRNMEDGKGKREIRPPTNQKPSWGGRIEAKQLKLSFPEDERFQCGR